MKFSNIIKSMAVVALVGGTISATAQSLHTGYFLESNVQRHEMNAAFGGEQNYFMLPALGGISMGVHTNMGLNNYIFERNGEMVTALSPQVSANDFINGLPAHQRAQVALDVPLLGVGFRAWGGFNTIVMKSRVNLDVNIPSSLMAFIKQGQDPSASVTHYDIDNLSARVNAYSEIALGHSRKLAALEGFSYGVKLKFLLGSGYANVQMDHIGLDLSRNRWMATTQGSSVISGNMDIVEDAEGNINNFDYNSIAAGYGFGVDLGAVYTPAALPELTVSLGVNDIGFMSWTDASTSVAKGEFEYTGFENLGGDATGLENQLENLVESATDLIRFEDAGVANKTMALNTVLNVGAEYSILNRKISFGLLSSTRFAGEYTYAEGMAVVNFRPLKWLHMAINGSYSTYGGALGALINICPNGFNLFVGCDYFAPTMKFNNDGIPVTPVNANVRVGIAFPIGKI